MGSITSNIQTHIAAGSCDALDLPTKCAAKQAKRTQTIAVIYFIISIIFILNITAPDLSIIICCNYDTDF